MKDAVTNGEFLFAIVAIWAAVIVLVCLASASHHENIEIRHRVEKLEAR